MKICQNGWKMVKSDEKWSDWMKILAIRKWVFEKKLPKLAFLKKKSPSGDISPVKGTLSSSLAVQWGDEKYVASFFWIIRELVLLHEHEYVLIYNFQ
jgi:hypothetical protein